MPKHPYRPSILHRKFLFGALGAVLVASAAALPVPPVKAHEAVIAMLEKRGTAAEVVSWLQSLLVSPAHAAKTGEFKGPTEPTGISVKDLGKFDLGKELKGMGGRDVRARLWTMEVGGIVPVHSHKDRPAQIYVLAGEVVEHRSDSDAPHAYRKGDLSVEAEGVVHWWENKGSETVVLLAVDIFNTKN